MDLSRDSRVQISAYEGPFNFSRQCNNAAKNASAPYLLFLNDDMTPVGADSLRQLLLPFQNAEVGSTGPLIAWSRWKCAARRHVFAIHECGRAYAPGGAIALGRLFVYDPSAARGELPDRRRNGYRSQLIQRSQRIRSSSGYLPLRCRPSGARESFGAAGRFNPYSVLLHMESTSIPIALEVQWSKRSRSVKELISAAVGAIQWHLILSQPEFLSQLREPQDAAGTPAQHRVRALRGVISGFTCRRPSSVSRQSCRDCAGITRADRRQRCPILGKWFTRRDKVRLESQCHSARNFWTPISAASLA